MSLVLGLHHAADATLTLKSVSQGDGVLLLLRNTPQVLADQSWLRVPLESAVGDAACYTGRRGEAREAAAAILRLAAGAEFGISQVCDVFWTASLSGRRLG